MNDHNHLSTTDKPSGSNESSILPTDTEEVEPSPLCTPQPITTRKSKHKADGEIGEKLESITSAPFNHQLI